MYGLTLQNISCYDAAAVSWVMPSRTYRLFREGIEAKKQIVCSTMATTERFVRTFWAIRRAGKRL